MADRSPDTSCTASDLDAVFEALAARPRRQVLRVLRSRGGEVGMADLARAVAERDGGDDPAADRRERVRVALHHRHLPKLADAGLVTVADGTVGLATGDGPLAAAEELLDRTGESRRRP